MIKTNEIAAQLLFVLESGDVAAVNSEDYVASGRNYRQIAEKFVAGVNEIFIILPAIPLDKIQYELYEIGKRHFGVEKDELNLWFKCLYSIFFGTENGPRIGEFVTIYGVEDFLRDLRVRCENPLRLP